MQETDASLLEELRETRRTLEEALGRGDCDAVLSALKQWQAALRLATVSRIAIPERMTEPIRPRKA